jgi:short-subunit dehydrogenase
VRARSHGLRGGTALLTGAGGGLGPFVARALAAEGAGLVLSGLESERGALEALRAELRTAGAAAEVVTADLVDPDELDGLWGRAEEAAGPIDVLVNNAGYGVTAAYASFTGRELERMVAVNLTAPMVLTRHAVAAMLPRGPGHVVFMASLAGRLATAYNEPYAATKAGLIALSQSLRAEHHGTPLGFSAICPGMVAGAGMYTGADRGRNRLPFLARSATPEDVAAAVVRAIRRDRPEIIVSPRPMRPVVAFAALAPRASAAFLRRVGTDEVFRRMARARGRALPPAPGGPERSPS